MTASYACDLAPAHVRAIAPYQPGKPIAELARELGLAESGIVKLASNENPLGPSPRGLDAAQEALREIARYPDGSGHQLRTALMRELGVRSGQIVLGSGSNDVLDLVARAFLAPGSSAVYAQHAFAVYALATQAMGAAGLQAPARNHGHDLAAMRAALRADTRVVFVANPNNPTGTLLPNGELEAFLEEIPPQVLVVLDEAYTEYLAEDLRSKALEWLDRFPNLIVTRTFSKAYGLAGLRVGYALAHEAVADLLNRVRLPFNVTAPALAAAAAALGDDDFLARSYALNNAGRKQLTDGCARLGLECLPSHGNFIAVRVGEGSAVFRRLLHKGVIVRPVDNYGMPEYLRVSVGLASENQRFLDALAEVLPQ